MRHDLKDPGPPTQLDRFQPVAAHIPSTQLPSVAETTGDGVAGFADFTRVGRGLYRFRSAEKP